MYNEYEITQMPTSLKSCRDRIEQFLSANALRLDKVDYYAVVTRLGDDTILAGGGLAGDVIKCIAVDDSLRGTGMSQRLVSHLLSEARERGHHNVKVFTKPSNADIFESLGFKTIATSPLAILMEEGIGGIETYCTRLKALRTDGDNGVIVMNCNPFTRGHRYLVEQAASRVNHLYVIVVNEDLSLFSATERFEMAQKGCSDLKNVTVCHGSEYTISATTFPTYFLKRLEDASDTQMTLDLDLFARHIAPALGAKTRFIGSEPDDCLTHRYNELMKQQLPGKGIEVVEIERLEERGNAVSASSVRHCLATENLNEALALVPDTSIPYLVAKTAVLSLRNELETTPKPGLVDLDNNGAHSDMDKALMDKSIDSLAPFFDKLALMGYATNLPQASDVIAVGLEAEKAMLEATNGINTHRGALFSMGLAVTGICHSLHNPRCNWQTAVSQIANEIPASEGTNGHNAHQRHNSKSALEMARSGYNDVTDKWLPYYHDLCDAHDGFAAHKALLLIMSQLDDTNIIHRVGIERATRVKQQAQALLANFSLQGLEEMDREFILERISPGGAADMLALTMLAHSATKRENNKINS